MEIRELATLAEYRDAVALQEATWGPGFSERVPVSIMKVARALGGVAAGAFDADGRLVGFVFGITGLRDGEVVHWSDMLAVATEARGRGIGRALKRHQREVVTRLGVDRMYWTVDPLEAGNNHLNMNVLGARAVAYHRDFYGPSDSPLHAGLGTDRFEIRWDLSDAAGVGDAPTGADSVWEPDGLPAALSPAATASGEPLRPGVSGAVEGPDFRVAIPARIQALKARDPEVARAWREATRSVLEPAMARGAVVDAVARRGDVAWLRVRG